MPRSGRAAIQGFCAVAGPTRFDERRSAVFLGIHGWVNGFLPGSNRFLKRAIQGFKVAGRSNFCRTILIGAGDTELGAAKEGMVLAIAAVRGCDGLLNEVLAT